MDKITVVCHKDHVVGYEDYRDQCLLCVVEDLMREVGRLTAACKEKEWVGLTHDEVNSWELPDSPTVFEFAQFIEAKLREKNCG